MKKLNYLLIFLIGFAQISYAKLPKISLEHSEIAKKKYAQEVRTAKIMRAACLLTAVSAVGYFTYEWLVPSDTVRLEFSKEDIAKIKDNMVAYFEHLKLAKIEPISWAKWFKNSIFSIPGFLVGLGSTAVGMGFHQMAQQVGSDLFIQRTLWWFAERRTIVAQTLNELLQEAEAYKRGLITKVQLNQNAEALLGLLCDDIEKIIGYCMYAYTALPTDLLYNRTIAKTIMQRIEILTNQFITDMEQQPDTISAIVRYTQDINAALKSFAALEKNQNFFIKV